MPAVPEGVRPKGSGAKKKDRTSKESKDIYTGDLSSIGKREGVGTCRFADGEAYTGEWKSNKMDVRRPLKTHSSCLATKC